MSFVIRNKINIKTAAKISPIVVGNSDLYWNNVSLLLKGDGGSSLDGDSITPYDASPNNFSLVKDATLKQRSYSPFASGGGSIYSADTTAANVTVTNPGSNFAFAGDFTIEGWINIKPGMPAGEQSIYAIGTTTYFTINYSFVSQTIILYFNSTSGTYTVPATMAAGVWYHIALVRSGSSAGNIKLYLNGVSIGGTMTNTSTLGFASPTLGPRLGAIMNQYATNLRIVKGTAVYTSNFTPSTTPLTAVSGTLLLLKFDSVNGGNNSTVADSSGNGIIMTKNGAPTLGSVTPFTASGGSVYFNGSTDYLTTPRATSLDLATGDFTVEAWAYFNSFAANCRIVGLGQGAVGGGPYTGWALNVINSGAALSLYRYDGTETYQTGNFSFSVGQWYHIAASRSGTTLRLFVNGTQIFSGTNSLSYSGVNSDALYIGTQYDGAGGNSWKYVNGYLTNIHVVKGTSLYTTGFTPSSVPLVPISSTSLLIKGESSQVIDSTRKSNLFLGGDTKISTTQKQYDAGSIAFDGSGDYITIPATLPMSTSASFTIEYWQYLNAFPASPMVGNFDPVGATYNWGFGNSTNNDGGTRVIVVYGLTGTPLRGNTIISLSSWTHVAMSVLNGTISLYVNGVKQTNTAAINTIPSALNYLTIGGFASAQYLNGYIDDLRITKGIARYTSNFTPPASLPTS